MSDNRRTLSLSQRSDDERKGWRRRNHERGATLVEFAVVAPLLFLLLFGVIEFGRAIATYTAVTTAAREAARFATTIGEEGVDPRPYQDCDGIREAAFAKTPLLNRDNTIVSIAYNDAVGDDVINTCLEGDRGPDLTQSDRISVQVRTTFRSPVPLISNLVGDLNVSSIQRRTIYPGS